MVVEAIQQQLWLAAVATKRDLANWRLGLSGVWSPESGRYRDWGSLETNALLLHEVLV